MSKSWVILTEIFEDDTEFDFWSGINVWIRRPHLINKKIMVSEVIHTWISNNIELKFDDEIFPALNKYSFCKDIEGIIFEIYNISNIQNRECSINITKLIPRQGEKFSSIYQIVIKDPDRNTVIFWPNETVLTSPISPSFPYKLQFLEKRVIIEAFKDVSENNSKDEKSEEWLKTAVLPKIMKWCLNSPTLKSCPSLSVVSAIRYCENYHILKYKYGKKYVEMWPESTDPLKYVYEDIAIAAYLMTFWEEERTDLNLSSKQTFVDLGCGNGLLVDILTSEGYAGIGFDVRSRKIWKCYGPETKLVEMTIEPSDKYIFPEYDWIIGNHSDELTPWIPIVAARSSYKTRFFLLPCCFFSFNGKFERKSSNIPQYESYLNFLEKLCETAGFKVFKDKLRIPSTKRICLIGHSRSYEKEDEEKMDSNRNLFIEKYSIDKGLSLKKKQSVESTDENENKTKTTAANFWVENFKPRDRIEMVQNCTNLDKKFLDNTVKAVMDILLKEENYIPLEKGSETILWNVGGHMKLTDLIKSLDPSVLQKMKNQCGGFQTFLRKYRYMFNVADGNVSLPVPTGLYIMKFKFTEKRRKVEFRFHEHKCYFHFYHPQGCPVGECCLFPHQITPFNM